MRKLKQIIENVGQNRQITPELKVEDGKVYLETKEHKFKYEYGNWYIWCDTHWVNLQGGIPDYKTDVEDEILEKETNYAIEEISE